MSATIWFLRNINAKSMNSHTIEHQHYYQMCISLGLSMTFAFTFNTWTIQYCSVYFTEHIIGISSHPGWWNYTFMNRNTALPCGASMGRCGSGGRAVVWQSEGCRFDPTLGVSKCPWARHLTPNCSWRAGWYLAWQPIAVGVWMCVWMGEWEAKIVKRFG